MKRKPILMLVVGAVLGVAILVVAMGLVPGSPFSWKGAAAQEDATREGSERAPGTGIMYETKAQVVNLADTGGYRYLRLQVVLEFDGNPRESSGGEGKKGEGSLDKKLENKAPVMDDEIISVLTSKRVAEIISPEGKERLRSELKERLGKIAGEERILNVYFREFVVQ